MSSSTPAPQGGRAAPVARAARRAFFLVLALIATVGVLPPSWAASEVPPAEEKTATVSLAALRTMPERLEVTTGTTVSWVNLEPLEYPLIRGTHTLVAEEGAFESPDIAPGTRWSHRFNVPGTFRYQCRYHPTAGGEVVVTGEPVTEPPSEKEVTITEPDPDDPTGWKFMPSDLVIETGTTVIWRNNGKNVHTVTANDESFDSGDITPGSTWKTTFDSAGVFAYHCTPHPWMKAMVRVVIPGGDVPEAPPPAPPAPGGTMVDETPPVRSGPGPARLDVKIVEPGADDPNSWRFSPQTLEAQVGDTVVWTNLGGVDHTVTSATGQFDSHLIRPGRTFVRTFETPGVYAYACKPHPWMRGRVRVSEPGKEAPALTDEGATRRTAAAPPPAPVRRGGSGPVTAPVNIVEPSLADAMSWTFVPKVVDLKVGDSVVWRNLGAIEHTVTADSGDFDTGLLSPGTTFQRRFDRAGTYAYHCTPHPWMKGVVRVSSADGEAPPPLPEAPAMTSGEQAAGPGSRTERGALGGAAVIGEAPSLGSNRTFFLALLAAAAICALTWFGAAFASRPGKRTA